MSMDSSLQFLSKGVDASFKLAQNYLCRQAFCKEVAHPLSWAVLARVVSPYTSGCVRVQTVDLKTKSLRKLQSENRKLLRHNRMESCFFLFVAFLVIAINSACNNYGDVTKIETTGASAETAGQDHLTVTGVEASHKLAANDLNRMNKYKAEIEKVAAAHHIDPAVIAGIISRETRAGSPGLLTNGWSADGNGFGLMQIDKQYHTPEGEWNSEQHISQATGILSGFIKAIQKKFPDWSKEQQLKGGISAYNAGPGNVKTYDRMDIGTTGNDYSNDVVARAQWFKKNGY
ncbi:hypothetical protein GJAV_G00201740 [Gymnothorax javanicus]|nr:hypothetical protein GJAV_G00201740 [Gymnothorax javanicus]